MVHLFKDKLPEQEAFFMAKVEDKKIIDTYVKKIKPAPDNTRPSMILRDSKENNNSKGKASSYGVC